MVGIKKIPPKYTREKEITESIARAERIAQRVATDYNTFYSYLDVARGLTGASERDSSALRRDLKTTAYEKMCVLAGKYSSDSVLQSKLEEAERAIWPKGRR